MTVEEIYAEVRKLSVDDAGAFYQTVTAEFLKLAFQNQKIASSIAKMMGVTGVYLALCMDGQASWHVATLPGRPDSEITADMVLQIQGAAEVMLHNAALARNSGTSEGN